MFHDRRQRAQYRLTSDSSSALPSSVSSSSSCERCTGFYSSSPRTLGTRNGTRSWATPCLLV